MTRLQTSFRFVRHHVLMVGAVLAGAFLLIGTSASTLAGDDAAAPKFSTFASAADLATEVKFLVGDLVKSVADKDEYDSQVAGRYTRDGNTITLVAIALGLHDQDSSLKPHAKAIAAAARKLAQAKDYAATKQAVEDLAAAVDGNGSGGDELKWGKVATLNGLMKDEVPYINTKLQNSLKHFKKRAAEAAGHAATMALIAENAKLYVADTKQPNEGAKWADFSAKMQSAAFDLAAEVHAGNEAGSQATMDNKLNQSCHDCHVVFHPEKVDVTPAK